MKPAQSHRVTLRGLDAHVLTWGDPGAPKLFLLHGWMDVAASFQFLVDALAQPWYVIAPDLRGYGRSAWQPQGYWFADYIADLDALVDAFAPNETVHVAGHSLGGNVVLITRAFGRSVVARSFRSTASACRASDPTMRRQRSRAGSTPKVDPKGFASYASFDEVADRLQKNNARLPRDKAEFLARHWAVPMPDGRVRLASDPRHRLPFPTVYRIEETYAVWRGIAAPTLWIVGTESDIPKWLAGGLAGGARRGRPAGSQAAPDTHP
jgi:pimeloyl-ACP methyl ester carboxylesterase